MTIQRDLSHLQRGQVAHLNDDKPVYVADELDPVMFALLTDMTTRLYEGAHRDMAAPAIIRASSMASDCIRQVQYAMQRREPSEPMTLADLYRFNIGTIVHDWVAKGGKLYDRIVGVENTAIEVEQPFEIIRNGITYISGHGDLSVYTVDPKTGGRVRAWGYELKTINGTGFKEATLKQQGPREGAVRQLASAVHGLDLDGGTLVYLATELVGAQMAIRKDLADHERFLASWSFDREYCDRIVDEEIGLIDYLASLEDQLTPRVIGRPLMAGDRRKTAYVTNPRGRNGSAVAVVITDDGRRTSTPVNVWNCDYCSQRGNCERDGE